MNQRRERSISATHAYSWLRSGRLAIGSIPTTQEHWQALQRHGFQSVLSCCAPAEAPWQPPRGWQQAQVPLPDHRNPRSLDLAELDRAITTALGFYRDAPALYLHCWAGMERSPLVAVGLLCRAESLLIFDALAQVRSLHPPARPITRHLVLLEELLAH